MSSWRISLLAVTVISAFVAAAQAYHLCATGGPCQRDSQVLPLPDITEDFQFEMRNIYTDRQRGARLNLFIKYRYYNTKIFKDYSTETGTYDYRDLRAVIDPFLPAGGMNISRDTFWEVINREIAKALWQQFPIQGLSIRMEVQGMSSGGIPSHRASTVTMGNMEPFVSMTNHFPGCDGMDTAKGNAACKISPTWGPDSPKDDLRFSGDAKNKAGKHDKPAKCDTCA